MLTFKWGNWKTALYFWNHLTCSLKETWKCLLAKLVSLSWIKWEAKQNPKATVQSKRTVTKLMLVSVRLSILLSLKYIISLLIKSSLLLAETQNVELQVGDNIHLRATFLPRRTINTSFINCIPKPQCNWLANNLSKWTRKSTCTTGDMTKS